MGGTVENSGVVEVRKGELERRGQGEAVVTQVTWGMVGVGASSFKDDAYHFTMAGLVIGSSFPSYPALISRECQDRLT